MRKYVIVIIAIGLVGAGLALAFMSLRPTYTPAKVDIVPTVPNNSTNANNSTDSSDIIPNTPVSLLKEPLDPMLGRARVNTAAVATTTTVFSATSDRVQFVNGTSGQALQLHAYYEDYFSANDSSIATPSFSVSFDIMRDANDANYGHFVSYFNPATHAGWYFDVANATTQSIRFVLTNSNGTLFKTKDISLPVGKFEHITGTFDGSGISISDNSTLYDNITFNGTYNDNPQVPLRVGMGSFCNSCVPTGLTIDELKISDNQGTVSYWKFDNDLKDYAGNNDGVIDTLISGMVATPDGRILFNEKNTGLIMVLQNDTTQQFARLSDDYPTIMYGLLGITIDPDYVTNHYVYTYYTALDNQTGQVFNRVVRFTDNGIGQNMTIIFDHLPALNGYHSGGALGFGPDGKLYFTIGDGYTALQAQNLSSLLGKTIRINKDGTIPSDNPFPNSPIYTYGHRNVYGIAFNNQTGITAENGENSYDQINVLVKGGNYGWPTLRPADVNPELSNSTMVKPVMLYQYEIAPTQAVYYNGNMFPQLKGMFLIGSYNKGELVGLKIDNDGMHVREAVEIDIAANVFVDPITCIAVMPDGQIYVGGHSIYKVTAVSPLELVHPN
jgi:glucose/arabinose dehydrogenase